MRITVTSEDIDQGNRHDAWLCPVGRALMRAGIDHAGVLLDRLIFRKADGELSEIKLSARVTDWIKAFDMRCPVRPIAFDVSLPPELGMNVSSEAQARLRAA